MDKDVLILIYLHLHLDTVSDYHGLDVTIFVDFIFVLSFFIWNPDKTLTITRH